MKMLSVQACEGLRRDQNDRWTDEALVLASGYGCVAVVDDWRCVHG